MLQRRVKNKAKPQSGNQSSKILHIPQTGIVLYTNFTVKRKKKEKRNFFFYKETIIWIFWLRRISFRHQQSKGSVRKCPSCRKGENNFWLEAKKWSNKPSKAQLNKMPWEFLGGAEPDLKTGLTNCRLLMKLNKNKKSCPVHWCSDGHTLLAVALACYQSVHLRLNLLLFTLKQNMQLYKWVFPYFQCKWGIIQK